MKQQGRCTLSANADGRVLDRLAGLEKIISPDLVRQAVLATGRSNERSCRLTHEVMLWVVLAMGLLTDMPIRQVFKHARAAASGNRERPDTGAVQSVRGATTTRRRAGAVFV